LSTSIFFGLIALVPYALAQRYSPIKGNFTLACCSSDIKISNCFYNELFAFYLNRNTCWQMATNRNSIRL